MQLRYWDVFGHRRCPGPEAIIAVLRALDVELAGMSGVEDAIAARRRQRWRRLVEPVSVARGGEGVLRLRLPQRHADARTRVDIVMEDGSRRAWDIDLGETPPLSSGAISGEAFFVKHVPLPADLPLGYHRATGQIGGDRIETLIIAAPDTCATPDELGRARGWGTFLPLYALRTAADRGVGDYSGLAALAAWTANRGGSTVATLPLLPTGADTGSRPSPYSPLSRLFWSELFVDLDAVPELRRSAANGAPTRASAARRRFDELRDRDLVDYAEIATLERSLLVDGATKLFSADGNGERRRLLERFVERRPEVETYARFRAAMRRHGRPWSDWPARLRRGELDEGDYDPDIYRSHLLGQWLAHEQVGAAADAMRQRGSHLYVDLPLGVPHDSYDVWSRREQFSRGAAAGAPPDTFFLRGQNWALPPLHPERSRRDGHSYVRACLRHHLAVAGTLRIDHVMALHRLYWVPDGFPATEGVYVRYPARELWAILALESRRSRAVIVGEDLGTVPPAVRRAMSRNRAHGIYVVQTEVSEHRLPCLARPTPDSTACMNTHDMPTFASFRDGEDLRDLSALGILEGDALTAENAARDAKMRVLEEFLRHGGWLAEDEFDGDDARTRALLRASLRFLADSEAATLVVNLEDLWLEDRPQNVPGTSDERPNWRRRARYTLAQIAALPEVVEALMEIDDRRRAPQAAGGR